MMMLLRMIVVLLVTLIVVATIVLPEDSTDEYLMNTCSRGCCLVSGGEVPFFLFWKFWSVM
jgi:hypothetical protein